MYQHMLSLGQLCLPTFHVAESRRRPAGAARSVLVGAGLSSRGVSLSPTPNVGHSFMGCGGQRDHLMTTDAEYGAVGYRDFLVRTFLCYIEEKILQYQLILDLDFD